MTKKITYDMTGQQIGKLKVLKPTIFKKDSSIVWECLCNCGFICFVNTKHLRRKLKPTRSCGCGL